MNLYADQNNTDDMETTTRTQEVMSQGALEESSPEAGEEYAHVVRKRRLRRGRAIAATTVANAIARNISRT